MLRAPSCCGPIQKGQCQDCGHSGAKQRQWVGAGRATVDGNGPVTLWCWAGAPKSLKDIHELLSPQFWVVVISKKNSTYHCSNWFLCHFARPTLLDLTFLVSVTTQEVETMAQVWFRLSFAELAPQFLTLLYSTGLCQKSICQDSNCFWIEIPFRNLT